MPISGGTAFQGADQPSSNWPRAPRASRQSGMERIASASAMALRICAGSSLAGPVSGRAGMDALPDGLDIGGGRELQRGMAAAALKAGGCDTTQHVARIATAVGVQHRGPSGAQPVHAHGARRHVQFLGDEAEGGDEVAGPSSGGPDDLDSAGGTVNGDGRRQGAAGRDRLPLAGHSIWCRRSLQRRRAAARLNRLSLAACSKATGLAQRRDTDGPSGSTLHQAIRIPPLASKVRATPARSQRRGALVGSGSAPIASQRSTVGVRVRMRSAPAGSGSLF